MSTENSLVIKRTFAASAERVFAAWTRPELLKQWMGPGPVTVSEAEVDLSVGGDWLVESGEAEVVQVVDDDSRTWTTSDMKLQPKAVQINGIEMQPVQGRALLLGRLPAR